jgi:hypothetical protein
MHRYDEECRESFFVLENQVLGEVMLFDWALDVGKKLKSKAVYKVYGVAYPKTVISSVPVL